MEAASAAALAVLCFQLVPGGGEGFLAVPFCLYPSAPHASFCVVLGCRVPWSGPVAGQHLGSTRTIVNNGHPLWGLGCVLRVRQLDEHYLSCTAAGTRDSNPAVIGICQTFDWHCLHPEQPVSRGSPEWIV